MKSFLIIFFQCCFITTFWAQATVNVEHTSSNVGNIVSVPVVLNVDGDMNLSVYQFSLQWDSNQLTYLSTSDYGIPSLTTDHFGEPAQTGLMNQLNVGWENYPDFVAINTNLVLFKVNFQIAENINIAETIDINICNDCITEMYNALIQPINTTWESGAITMSSLPLNWLKFVVNLTTEQSAQLTWQTATEQDNHHFEVQRSTDSKNWTSLEKILSQGNNQATQSYDYLDKSPIKGINYYRLKQVDNSRQFTYSSIESINLKSDVQETLIYPNPFHDKLTVDLSQQQAVEVKIFDVQGKVILQKTLTAEQVHHINLHQFTAGLYWIELKNNELLLTEKIVKE